MESLHTYFKKIEELIEDNEKIVTIPYFAISEHVSLQNSQQIVEEFVERKKKIKPYDITVTYVLRGFLHSGKGKGIFIVSDSSLSIKRKLFEKVDEVVFSIQKSKNTDFNVISLVDKFDSIGIPRSGPLLGCIIGKNCSKRVTTRKLALPPVETYVKSFESVETNNKIGPEAVTRTEIVDVSNKAVALSIKRDIPKNTCIKDNKNKKGKSGITNFFKAVPSNNSSDNKGIIQKEKDISKTGGVESEIGSRIESPRSLMEEGINQQVLATNSKPKDKINIKRRREENLDKNNKRRKRIVEKSDSESDDIFETVIDEVIIEKSEDEPDPVFLQDSLETKNKQRKAIDKTYQDDEGFIVTKTEYVYETASEDENESTGKSKIESRKKDISIKDNVLYENIAKEKKEKKNAKQNQPTLMNFFKKK